MGEVQPQINAPISDDFCVRPCTLTEAEENSPEINNKSLLTRYKWWFQMLLYSFFLLSGSGSATILGRLYYNNGGKSNWIATLVQVIGFPILIPFLFFTTADTENRRRPLALAAFNVAIGVFLAVDCLLFSIGLRYLPIITYTLIGASQLGFNAVFSLFLNRQKFTPFIVNSLVLLTVSSTLLVFDPESGDSTAASGRKYVVGFVCTVAASAGYAMMLSLTQLAFQKLIKKETARAVMEMTIYQSLVASIVVVIALFASGEWRHLGGEMDGYKRGKVGYLMNLAWTAVGWQVFGVGCVGLIFQVSALFANVIGMLGLPMGPVLAVMFLGDRLSGLKAVAMVVAMWGFVSYIYQHYLDDLEMKERQRSEDGVQLPLVDQRGASAAS
ncbi:probable purine permease 10 [Salvia hispanica]|uniref:probable purine permease 10 n=1 Tax=Salvia hispanica TaxID=49212 RepID=UPI0020094093|nr:probable purine permease 10 [Salvia hispanica]